MRGIAMGILLQSSVGPFDESFVARIPQLEKLMTAHGLDPSDFVIAKDRSLFTNARPFGSRLWDYTVFVDGDHFTVTKPDDLSFLSYFIARCLAPEEAPQPPRPPGLFARVMNWMNAPI